MRLCPLAVVEALWATGGYFQGKTQL